MLDQIEIKGKVITTDALLTQRTFAEYLVKERKAHYHFTVKGNQKQLLEDLVELFRQRGDPDYAEPITLAHGRIEQRKIWVSNKLNDYLEFPHVGQVFLVERHVIEKKTGKESAELAYGITSCKPDQASPKKVLATNRSHWCIENCCHYIVDTVYNEDRSRIRTGNGPENMTRLRRFAVGLLKSRGVKNIAEKMRQLLLNTRQLLDILKMTKNSCRVA